MSERGELLPCPFCHHQGDDADANFETNQGTKWGAFVCPGCSAWGPEVRTGYGPPSTWKAAAIAAWNRRAPSPTTEGVEAKNEAGFLSSVREQQNGLASPSAPAGQPTPAALREWLPIETAPRDGTMVILYDRPEMLDYDYAVCIGFYDGEQWRAEHGQVWPTHWMPLPEPPGQPYGFTWEDVDALRHWTTGMAVHARFDGSIDDVGTSFVAGNLRDLADRIAALLPPRETPG